MLELCIKIYALKNEFEKFMTEVRHNGFIVFNRFSQALIPVTQFSLGRKEYDWKIEFFIPFHHHFASILNAPLFVNIHVIYSYPLIRYSVIGFFFAYFF
jgi:hypothetical protein